MKFKVGDLVKVVKADEGYPPEKNLIGKIARISEAEEDPIIVEWLLPLPASFINSIGIKLGWMTSKNWLFNIDQVRALSGLEKAILKAKTS
jgi:hypothetical protein